MASLDNEELAAMTGFTVAFFKSNNELERIWNKAKRNQWDPSRILAAMRQTKWFRRHSEAERQAQLLKTSDPAEYRERLNRYRAKVLEISRQTGLGHAVKGSRTSYREIRHEIAKLAFLHNWTDAQIKNRLASYDTVYRRVKGDQFETRGLVGQGERLGRQLSYEYGINVNENRIARHARHFGTGGIDAVWLRDWYIGAAKKKYAGIADQIDGGLTVREIAEPYVDSMARLWEINPNDIELDHNRIRKALSYRPGRDTDRTLQPLWKFEEELRRDNRWKATNNGREAMFGAGYRVLRDLELVI